MSDWRIGKMTGRSVVLFDGEEPIAEVVDFGKKGERTKTVKSLAIIDALREVEEIRSKLLAAEWRIAEENARAVKAETDFTQLRVEAGAVAVVLVEKTAECERLKRAAQLAQLEASAAKTELREKAPTFVAAWKVALDESQAREEKWCEEITRAIGVNIAGDWTPEGAAKTIADIKEIIALKVARECRAYGWEEPESVVRRVLGSKLK